MLCDESNPDNPYQVIVNRHDTFATEKDDWSKEEVAHVLRTIVFAVWNAT